MQVDKSKTKAMKEFIFWHELFSGGEIKVPYFIFVNHRAFILNPEIGVYVYPLTWVYLQRLCAIHEIG